MKLILSGLRLETCVIYLDHVIVYGKRSQRNWNTEEVFSRFKSAGLKLKQGKHVLFQKSVMYLGHIVSARGIETDPVKVERVCDWPVPGNATEVKSI